MKRGAVRSCDGLACSPVRYVSSVSTESCNLKGRVCTRGETNTELIVLVPGMLQCGEVGFVVERLMGVGV